MKSKFIYVPLLVMCQGENGYPEQAYKFSRFLLMKTSAIPLTLYRKLMDRFAR
jgi:hypothetical protein